MTTIKVGSKTKTTLLEPIGQVGPILPSALIDIVDSRGEADHTTFETKDRLFEYRPSRGQEQKSWRPRTKDTIFINDSWQIFHILNARVFIPEMETGRVDRHRSGRSAGRVEILRSAGRKTGRILLFGN